MAVGRFGNQHARDKCAQRHAQTRRLCQPRQPQGGQQDVEHKEFIAFAPGHQGQPPVHDALPARQQQGDDGGGFQTRQGQFFGHGLGWAAQGGDDHQQRHHGQVLKQQHAQRALALLGGQLATVLQHFDDDGGAAHGQCATQHQRALPVELERRRQPVHQPQRQPHHGQHGQHGLRPAQHKYMAAHAAQFGQIELQPNHEHQKHHTKLGQMVNDVAGAVIGQRQGVGPQYHPSRQIGQHGWQFQAAANHHAQNGG